jgi:secreted trypsin-like serine protease
MIRGQEGDLRLKLGLLMAVALVAVFTAGAARGITFGQVDGTAHPQVGALLADYDNESPGPEVLCTGTLLAGSKTSSAVFLTAGHCTAFLESVGISQVWVTFAPSYDEDSTSTAGLFPGTYVTNPAYPGKREIGDLAVVLLNGQPAATPATLAPLGLLDSLKASGALNAARFTTVGYGTVREDKTKGPQTLFFDGVRRSATQGFRSLQDNWLNLSMNPSVGSGGTCYGDSGGPHFLGSSLTIASITVTGDRWCRATDVSYRVDTSSARAFLGNYVTLP